MKIIKRFKKVGIFILVFLMLISSSCFNPINLYAAEKSVSIENGLSIDIITDDNLEISEPMSAEEVIADYAKNKGVTKEKAAKALGISLDNNNRVNLLATENTYRTLKHRYTVTTGYMPCVEFYCQTSEYGNWWGIVRVLNTNLDVSYNGLVKVFNGTIYTNLQNAYTIYVIVNGHYYNTGTTTWTGGGSIGIGEAATITGTISYASSWFAYKNYVKTLMFQ